MENLAPWKTDEGRRFLFRLDLEVLVMSYEGAIKAVEGREMDLEKRLRSQLSLDPTDPFPDPDTNDPDDYRDLLYGNASELAERLRRGAHVIRKTFLIALFHLWERHNKLPIRRTHPNRGLLNKLVLDLESVANCAKHKPGRAAEKLLATRPDLFPNLGAGQRPTERTLVIGPAVFEEFVSAMTAIAYGHESKIKGETQHQRRSPSVR